MSKFRTLEISDPRFESGDLRFITVKTHHLRGRGDICVFVPPGVQSSSLPIVILLHGVYGSAWVWTQKAGAHLTARGLIAEGRIRPMIIAMPSDGLWGDGSGYLAHSSLNFEKWICEDVPDAVREAIPQAARSTVQFISGLSMGGFGAMRIGAKYPDQFRAISAHSAITSLEQMALFVEEPLRVYRQETPVEEDVFLTIEESRGQMPPLRFDCGSEDPLIEYNRQLHRKLKEAGISHQYEEFEGTHEWAYWEEHLADTLLFFDQHL